MINRIWFFLISVGIIISLIFGNIDVTMLAINGSVKSSVELVIGLTGFLCFWNGIIRIAEKSGLTMAIARKLKPLFYLLFKREGRDEKVLGSIVMNLASNMCGISNAATPFGIRAMEDMQMLNDDKDRATDDMVLFLVMNASCIQIIPTTIISIRSAEGAINPAMIIIPAILSTSIAAIVGILSCKILERYF